jgi:hypothetical protein
MDRVAIARVGVVAATTTISRHRRRVRFSQAVAVEGAAAHRQAAEAAITPIRVIKEAATTESDLCMHN